MNIPNYPFSDNERIVRTIFTPKNINPNTNNLRSSFVGFRFIKSSGKFELSCNRLELDTIENLRMLGKHYEPPRAKYYGLACITVQKILSFGKMDVAFTPILETEPKNPSHCDIYDNTLVSPVKIGEAQPAEDNQRRSEFVKLWAAYKDEGNLLEQNVLPK